MFNTRTLSRIAVILGILIVIMGTVATIGAFADTESGTPAETTQVEAVAAADSTGMKAIGSGIAIGIAAFGGAIGMGFSGGKAAEGISRQPEADGKIRTNFMLTLVFIETVVIYALLAVILIIFVL
jgi:F-type H+-transporting ATPase subunit c